MHSFIPIHRISFRSWEPIYFLVSRRYLRESPKYVPSSVQQSICSLLVWMIQHVISYFQARVSISTQDHSCQLHDLWDAARNRYCQARRASLQHYAARKSYRWFRLVKIAPIHVRKSVGSISRWRDLYRAWDAKLWASHLPNVMGAMVWGSWSGAFRMGHFNIRYLALSTLTPRQFLWFCGSGGCITRMSYPPGFWQGKTRI